MRIVICAFGSKLSAVSSDVLRVCEISRPGRKITHTEPGLFAAPVEAYRLFVIYKIEIIWRRSKVRISGFWCCLPEIFPLNLILCINNEKTIDRLNPPACDGNLPRLSVYLSQNKALHWCSLLFWAFSRQNVFFCPINVRLLSKILSRSDKY